MVSLHFRLLLLRYLSDRGFEVSLLASLDNHTPCQVRACERSLVGSLPPFNFFMP